MKLGGDIFLFNQCRLDIESIFCAIEANERLETKRMCAVLGSRDSKVSCDGARPGILQASYLACFRRIIKYLTI